MPRKRSTRVTSPQQWRKKTIRQTPRRSEQRTAQIVKTTIKREWSRVWIRRLFTAFVLIGLVALIVGFTMIAWYSRDLPEPGGVVTRDVPLSTKIYDRTGTTLLYEIYAEQQRTSIKIADLPNHITWATIVAEDRNFYSHTGFKFTSIVRALLINLFKGGRVQGGSTITQQFIKNALLTTEKSYIRKIKELILAWQIENRFTKEEILELYFNEIPYGSTAYGIEAAAQSYFGKPAKNLSIAEAAVLAALPKAPSYYSPYGSHKDELLGRQQFIIKAMLDEGYITQEETSAAQQEIIEFKPFNSSIRAPHFVFFVRELLSQKYGERALEQGGLKVITTLDMFKQSIAQEIIEERGEINAENFNASNAAFVALDAKTGEILSMIGSRDFFNAEIDGEVNVVTRPRQPGSSFKPIVYAAAFKQGLSPETILYDIETTFKTVIEEDYEPKNYNLVENGPVSIRQALGSSLNIPAVKTIYLTGVDNVLDLADSLHYSTLHDRSRFGLSLVLGGAEVTLLDHAAAYAAFAREGLYKKPVAILKIEDKEGRILEEFDSQKIKKEQVIDTEIARQINSILSDNNARLLTFNENNYLTLGERSVAAKTGTTNDFRDAWTLGYTPSLVAGVWVGNNDNTEMKGNAAGGALAAPIWNKFMKRVLGDTPFEFFNAPQQPTLPNKPMFNGTQGFNNLIKINRITGKLATEYTPKKLVVEKKFIEVHNILHYARRHNLLGPIPETPWDDPNYTSWEIAVERWAKKNDIISEKPPTESDDLYRVEDQPNLTIVSPANNTLIPENTVTIILTSNVPRGASRLEYYIDDLLIKSEPLAGEKTISNHSTTISLPNTLENGSHILKTIVYDDIENDTEVKLTFNISF